MASQLLYLDIGASLDWSEKLGKCLLDDFSLEIGKFLFRVQIVPLSKLVNDIDELPLQLSKVFKHVVYLRPKAVDL